MKKLILLLWILVAGFSPVNVFAQNYGVVYATEFLEEKIDEFSTIQLIYDPTTNNLMVIYIIKNKSFDEAAAVIVTRDRIISFMKEKGFYHYKNYSEDIIKHRNSSAEYTRFIILSE